MIFNSGSLRAPKVIVCIFGALLLFVSNASLLAQCPTTAPTGIPECRIGTGSLILGASGATGYYNWYDAATGGNYLGAGSTYQTPVISSTTDYYVAAANSNKSLDFDGLDDYVAIGNPAALQITGDLTLEMWLKPANFSARRNPYAKAYGGEGTITQETDGSLNFYYGTNGGNGTPYQAFNSVVALELNKWNHIALVRDLTNGILYWYINGQLTNQATATYAAATAGSNNVTIAAGYVSTYAGKIDEVRVWNIARSQAQIQNNMNYCLLGTETGLAAYWEFNDGSGTTLTDKSPNGLNGTLTNMDPATDWLINSPDISCASCESARTTVTATITTGTPIDLGTDRCFDVTEVLDPGAGFSSYLWQDGSINQTFTATTTGTYYVEVQDGSGCIDRDTVRLQINPALPTGTGSCRIGTGSVTLTASGSTGNYNWYNAATGGSLLGSGASFNTPVISATTDFYVAAANPDYTLDFDGTNDYVDIGNPIELQITGDMTIEMWLKPTDFSARRNPYAKAYGGEGTITQETDGTLSYFYGTSGSDSNPYQGFGSVIPLTLNEWNHVAIVRDLTNMQLYWYINGTLVRQTAASYASATAGPNPVLFGAGYVSNYAGQIGEVRIWNTARTGTEIQNNTTTCCDCLANTALVGIWDFNDGPGSTVVSDLTDNGNNGTLTNMDPATDWLSDAPEHSCEACESPRVAVTATVSSSTPVNLGADATLSCSGGQVLDAGAGYSGYLWQDGSTGQTFSATTGGTYWVEVQDGGGCIDQDSVKFINPASARTALDFDGIDDYVTVGNPAELQITGDQTIEMWLKPANFSARRNPYAKAYGGEGTITQETDGTLNYYYGTAGSDANPYQGVNSSVSLNLNEWNHIAIVRDLTNMQLYWYINGVLTNNVAATYAAAQSGGNTVFIGDGYTSNYAGQIDEVRIWNTARSQTQIRENMGKRLIGTEAGLAAYFRFDEGTGTTLTDETPNNLNGTLVNMDPATDWVTSTAPIGDFTAYLFTGSWTGQSVNLAPCGQDDVTLSNVSGTPAGVLLYYIGTVPNDVTGIIGIGNNDRYFGVWKFNDPTATYTFTYNYVNNPHIDLSDEANLALFKRADNTATPWIDAAATIDVAANTLTATAQSTEFMLGSNGLPLPITLVYFTGETKPDHIALTWQTSSELNNDYFTIERSPSGEDFVEIAKVSGSGSTTQPVNYTFDDFTAWRGNNYYRLLQTDFDGTTTVHQTILVHYKGINKPFIRIYPNPSRQGQTVSIRGGNFEPNQNIKLELLDMVGNTVFTADVLSDLNGNFFLEAGQLPAGGGALYIVRATGKNNSAVAKMAVK